MEDEGHGILTELPPLEVAALTNDPEVPAAEERGQASTPLAHLCEGTTELPHTIISPLGHGIDDDVVHSNQGPFHRPPRYL